MKTTHQLNLSAPVTQSGGQTLDNSIPRKWFALGFAGILYISVCALLASPAQAQCQNWDVSGKWTLRGPGELNLKVDLQQEGGNVFGTGTLSEKDMSFDVAMVIGSGNITANSFAIAAVTGKTVFHYSGTIRPDGTLSGTVRRDNDTLTDLYSREWVDSIPKNEVRGRSGKILIERHRRPAQKA